MPKQIHKIDQFHGGLSNNSDPRDIADNEVSTSEDINLTDLGKVKLLGGFIDNSGAVLPVSDFNGMTSGVSVFNYSVDDSEFVIGSDTVSGVSSDYIVSELVTTGDSGQQGQAIINHYFTEGGATNNNTVRFRDGNGDDTGLLTGTFNLLAGTSANQEQNWNTIRVASFNPINTIFRPPVVDYLPGDGDMTSYFIKTRAHTDTYNGYYWEYKKSDGSPLNVVVTSAVTGGESPITHEVKVTIKDAHSSINYVVVVEGVYSIYNVNEGDTIYDIANGLGAAIVTSLDGLGYVITHSSTSNDIIISRAVGPFSYESYVIVSDIGALSEEKKDEFTVLTSKSGSIYAYSLLNKSWQSIGFLSEGNFDTQPNYYMADGNLRLCDGAFGNNSAPLWYGRINRQLFKNTTSPISLKRRELLGAEISTPPGGFVSKVELTSVPKEFSQIPADVDVFSDDTNYASANLDTSQGASTHNGGAGHTEHYLFSPADLGGMSIVTNVKITWKTDDSVLQYYQSGNGQTNQFVYWTIMRIGTKATGLNFDSLGYRFTDVNTLTNVAGGPKLYAVYIPNEGGYMNYTATQEMSLDQLNISGDELAISAGVREQEDTYIDNGVSSPLRIQVTNIEVSGLTEVPDLTYPENNTKIVVQTGASTHPNEAWSGNIWKAGCSYLYDENQESLVKLLSPANDLSQDFSFQAYDEAEVLEQRSPWVSVNLKYSTTSWNPRITGIKIYLRRIEDNEWLEFVECNFLFGKIRASGTDNWIPCTYDVSSGGYSFAIYNGKDLSSLPFLSYESATGVSQKEVSLSAQYKTGLVSNRCSYIGNIQYTDRTGERVIKEDAILKSPVNKFDTFVSSRKLEAAINDGDEIVKLESFADRLLQFNRRKMYLINIAQEIEFLESVHDNLGLKNQSASIRTEFGIAWVNENGCYLYNGKSIVNLLERDGRRLIDENVWSTFASSNPSVFYFPKKKQFIVIDDIVNAKNIFFYDLITRSWSKGNNKIGDGSQDITISNSYHNKNSELLVLSQGFDPYQGSITCLKWDDIPKETTNLDYRTKDIDFGQPGQRKKVNAVYITYKCDDDGDDATVTTNVKVSYATDGSTSFGYDFSDVTTYFVSKVLQSTGGEWTTIKLKPDNTSESNNIQSFRLKIFGNGSIVPSTFEINDISIVYRLKPIR